MALEAVGRRRVIALFARFEVILRLLCDSFIALYQQRPNAMSEAQTTTKTVVVANDIHKAIRVYAEENDRAIQDVVDDVLRGDEDLRQDVMTTYDRLEKAGNLPSASA